MKKKLLTVAMAATMVISSVFSAFAEDVDASKTYDSGLTVDGSTGWNSTGGDQYLFADKDVTVKFTNAPFIRDTDNWSNFVFEIFGGEGTKGITLRADAFGWTYGDDDLGNEPTYEVTKTWEDDWDLFKTICQENTNVSITFSKKDANTVTATISFGSAATEVYTITYPDGVPASMRVQVGADGGSVTINEAVIGEAEAPTSDDQQASGDDQQASGDDQQATDAPSDAAPATADTAPIVMVAGVALAACAVVLATKKSRVTE